MWGNWIGRCWRVVFTIESAMDYPTLKTIHITLVSSSVVLFFARWLGVLNQAAWPMRAEVRWVSVAIDSALLLAGVSLWHMLGLRLWDTPWLLAKLLLLPVYVVLGSFALKRAPSSRHKMIYGVLALVIVAHMAGIAIFRLF